MSNCKQTKPDEPREKDVIEALYNYLSSYLKIQGMNDANKLKEARLKLLAK